jgi:hypothetical protein
MLSQPWQSCCWSALPLAWSWRGRGVQAQTQLREHCHLLHRLRLRKKELRLRPGLTPALRPRLPRQVPRRVQLNQQLGAHKPVYQDVTLHISAMGPNESAGVTFTPPAGVTLNPGIGSDDDLEYFNSEGVGDSTSTQSWDLGSGDALADIGTQNPSPTACNQLITTDPMDLSTQNFKQGQGYCIQIADGGIGYFRILSIAQSDENGDSGAVVLTLTLWQS